MLTYQQWERITPLKTMIESAQCSWQCIEDQLKLTSTRTIMEVAHALGLPLISTRWRAILALKRFHTRVLLGPPWC
jgi:hypothetical protein